MYLVSILLAQILDIDKYKLLEGDSMKLIIMMMALMIASVSFAAQVDTECIAMNESREKVIKSVQSKSKPVKSAVAR